MNIYIRLLPACLAAALLLLCSCVDKSKKNDAPPPAETALAAPQQHRTVIEPTLLPTRFRQAGYMISEEKEKGADSDSSSLDGLQLKVGANITTNAPISLREAMKAIVKTKNMSLSWAPDVDQDLLVDIDVRANDNFYEAIDNILRQLDYFQEVEVSTLVIKYREAKQYHVAMPFINQTYSSAVGVDGGTGKGRLTIGSSDNKFDIWENIQKNIDKTIATWSATVAKPEQPKAAAADPKDQKKTESADGEEEASAPPARRVSSTDSMYTIDKPVGLITVHAPRSLQKRIGDYLATLEKELYKQIVIEAKIIEVQLSESSSLGINWNMLLNSLNFQGISYGKEKDYDRSSGESSRTVSSANFSDVTTDSSIDSSLSNSSKSSASGSSNDGTNSQSSANSSNTTSTNTATSGTTSSSTGLPTNTSGRTGSSTGTNIRGGASGSTLDSAFSDATESGSSSEESSSRDVSRTLSNALSMGSTAATFITSASGMSEFISTGVTLSGFNFTSFIKALQEQGQTSILSNPKISVMNGQPALISVGRNVTYIKEVKSETSGESGAMSTTVTTADILSGVGMALSAVVRDNNEIVMNLVPVTSELNGEITYVDIGQGNKIGLPVVNKREMSTTVKIKDGSMLVVGGLISEAESKDGNHIAGTKDIPYLKHLFGYEEKKRTKRELIILLRPRIIN